MIRRLLTLLLVLAAAPACAWHAPVLRTLPAALHAQTATDIRVYQGQATSVLLQEHDRRLAAQAAAAAVPEIVVEEVQE